jgi:putative two-component system response regulator
MGITPVADHEVGCGICAATYELAGPPARPALLLLLSCRPLPGPTREEIRSPAVKILVVEDDPMSINLLKVALSAAGHEMLVARNGREALDILRHNSIRFVISDWEMPEMSGVELCRAIRAPEFTRYIYTILLTGRSDANSLIEGLTAGADDFIQKPFNRDELTVRIRTGERIVSLETRDLAIFAMARLAESRDPESGAHLERVQNYARLLAEDLSRLPTYRETVDENYIRLLYLTSPLHDIGKVAIPDHVLLKPGRLDAAEFEIMKTHTTLGAETLSAAIREFPDARFLRMAQQIALTHHERFDGNGYPCNLKGHDIPLCGRIVALADVYDALTSKRVYKSAMAHAVARSVILQDRGTHFDPDVVDAFVRCESKFLEIRNRFSETIAEAA